MELTNNVIKEVLKRRNDLNNERLEVLQKIEKFQYETKKLLLENGAVEFLSINWSSLYKVIRHR